MGSLGALDVALPRRSGFDPVSLANCSRDEDTL